MALHVSADAEVAEVLVSAGGGRAAERRFVKRHLDRPGASRPAVERARREGAVAARVAAWDGAPRPLAVEAAAAVVVFAPCPGEPLDRLLRRLRRRPERAAELTAAVAAAGRWLARFQSTAVADLLAAEPAVEGALSSCRPAAVASDTVVGISPPAAERGATRLAEAPAGGPPQLTSTSFSPRSLPVAATSRRIARLRARAAPGSFAPVPVHGDLWPGNLRIEGDVARALDFEGAAIGPRYADAAWFLLHLDLYLARPGLGGRRRALAAAFLASWLGDGESPDAAALAFFRALAARRLLDRSRGAAGPRAAWRRLLLRRELRRALAGGRRW